MTAQERLVGAIEATIEVYMNSIELEAPADKALDALLPAYERLTGERYWDYADRRDGTCKCCGRKKDECIQKESDER